MEWPGGERPVVNPYKASAEYASGCHAARMTEVTRRDASAANGSLAPRARQPAVPAARRRHAATNHAFDQQPQRERRLGDEVRYQDRPEQLARNVRGQ